VACDLIVAVLSAMSETARPSMMTGSNLIFDALEVRLDFELTSEMRSVVGLYLRTAEIWARWDGVMEALPWWIQSQRPLGLVAQVFSAVEMLYVLVSKGPRLLWKAVGVLWEPSILLPMAQA
jgi:hypothetical protein